MTAALDPVKRLIAPAPGVRRLPIGPARGLRLQIDFHRQSRLFVGLYETELNRHLRAFTADAGRAFDVGSNIGYDALLLAKQTRGEVIAFEADADVARELEANLAANGPTGDRVRLVLGPVGAPGSGGVVLDEVAAERGMPDLMKIDVDGAELDALRGAERILAERRPHLVIETHTAELEAACGDLLVAAGYRPVVVTQRRWLRDHRPTTHNRWLVASGAPGG